MARKIDHLGYAFTFTIVGFVLGTYFGGTMMGERYQTAMKEMDKSFRTTLGWQAPKDLQACREMLTAIVLSEDPMLALDAIGASKGQ